MLQPLTTSCTLSVGIPFKHAGMRLADMVSAYPGLSLSDDNRLTIDGRCYSVQKGYLVPYYEPQEQDLARRNEELVIDRANRFFKEAEPELDIRLSRKELQHEIYDYETSSMAEMHKIKARYLTGAMVNRMERLARAILQRNIEGIGLEIHPSSGTSALSDEEIKACRDEFSGYYKRLIMDSNQDPIRWVRRRDASTDHDGILLDLIREMGKPISMPEKMLRGAILDKIGYTMGAIDETHDSIVTLLEVPVVAKTIDRAYKQAMPTVYTDEDIEDKTRGSVRYRAMFEELTNLCRARAGLKSEDRQNFGVVRERITYLDSQLHEVLKQIAELRRLKGQSVADVVDIEQMLRSGLNNIRDMAQLRLPKNRNAQDVYDQPGLDKRNAKLDAAHARDGTADEEIRWRDASSVGRLTHKISTWNAKHQAILPGFP